MPRDLIAERQQPRDLLAERKKSPGLNERAHVASGAFLEGIPVVGPYIREGADRLGAVALSLMYDKPYDETLQRLQAHSRGLKEELPLTNTLGGVAGSVAGSIPMVMAAPAAFGLGGGSLAARSAASATSGGVIGGLDAGVRSDWDPDAIMRGGGIGAAVGGITPVVSDVIGAGWQAVKDSRAVKASAKAAGIQGTPTAAQIRASAGYDALKDPMKNATLSGKEYQNILKQVWNEAQEFGLTTELKRKFGGTLKDHIGRIKKNGTASLYDLELLRRSLRNVAGDKMDDAAQALSSRMIDKLDDLVDGLSSASVQTSGQSGRPVVDALKEARQMYRIGKKSQLIEDAILRAENAASGVENGLRNEFRKFLNNPSLRKNFTDAELAAIQQVVKGDLPTNALRWFGSFGYPIDQGRSFLGSAMGGGAGAAIGSMVGGPAGAAIGGIGLPAAGTAARYAALQSTQNAARLAEQAVKAPAFSSTYTGLAARNASKRALKEALVNAILRGTTLELSR